MLTKKHNWSFKNVHRKRKAWLLVCCRGRNGGLEMPSPWGWASAGPGTRSHARFALYACCRSGVACRPGWRRWSTTAIRRRRPPPTPPSAPAIRCSRGGPTRAAPILADCLHGFQSFHKWVAGNVRILVTAMASLNGNRSSRNVALANTLSWSWHCGGFLKPSWLASSYVTMRITWKTNLIDRIGFAKLKTYLHCLR